MRVTVLLCVLAMALVACSGDDPPNPPSTQFTASPTEEPTVLFRDAMTRLGTLCPQDSDIQLSGYVVRSQEQLNAGGAALDLSQVAVVLADGIEASRLSGPCAPIVDLWFGAVIQLR